MEHTPLVTVLVTTYNQEKYIAQALDSVLAQLDDLKLKLKASQEEAERQKDAAAAIERCSAFTWAMWSSSCVNSFSGWLMTHSSCEKDSHSRSRKHASSDSQLQEKV